MPTVNTMNPAQSQLGQNNAHQVATARMDMMEKPKLIIGQARAYLNDCKQNILKKYQDLRLTQWDMTNFEKYAAEISFFGLQQGIIVARDQHRKLSIDILKQIEKCENELGALELDINHNAISPEKALLLAEKQAFESAGLEKPLGEWNGYVDSLIEADKVLREKLTLSELVPFTLFVADKSKKEMIEEGYAFYQAITLEKPRAGNELTLQGYLSHAVQLEKILLDMDLGSLKGLPAAIVNHQIKTTLAAPDQLKHFIEEFRRQLPDECDAIADITTQLSELYKGDINSCLEQMDDLATTLSKNLISLRHKRKSYKQFEYIPLILQEVKNFHEVMTARIIPDLRDKVARPGSPVHPGTIAAELSAEYFTGLQGFVRAMKHLFGSIGGQQAIRLGDLREKIYEVLTTCEIYYGTTETDIGKLQNFLNEHLYGYNKPFPYEPLLHLMKQSISAYGSRLEKYLLTCRVDIVAIPDEEGTGSSPSMGGTLGRLLSKIEIHTANLSPSTL